MLKRLLILFLAICFTPVTYAWNTIGSDEKKDANGTVYTPAIELVNAKGQKVLVVGLNHTGFPEFYSSVNNLINTWTQQNQRKTLVMREFFTCSTSVYDDEGYVVQKSDVRALGNPVTGDILSINFQTTSFVRSTESTLTPLLSAFGMKKSPCLLDVDGKTMRPPYYVKRNKNWCDEGAKHGGACQWLSFNVPDTALVKNIDADLHIDQWPAGMQFVGAMLFAPDTMFAEFNSNDRESSELTQISAPASDVVLSYRTQLLLDQVSKALQSGIPQIVLPWGAAHVRLIYQALVKMGFKSLKVTDIQYMTRNDLGRWNMIDQTYNDPNYPIEDHYSFQDQ